MTLENQVYGVGWVCCALCGVRQPLTSLTPGLACKDLERCERWQAELKAQRTAAAKADPVLFTRVGDQGENALPLTDEEEQALRLRSKLIKVPAFAKYQTKAQAKARK